MRDGAQVRGETKEKGAAFGDNGSLKELADRIGEGGEQKTSYIESSPILEHLGNEHPTPII